MQTKHLIGAHVSSSGGYAKTLEKLKEMGGNCLQIFSGSPRDWRAPDPTKFTGLKFEVPTYFHATYLINLASDGEIGRKSKELLIAELNIAGKTGIVGSVVHTGSFKDNEPDFELLAKNIDEVLVKTPKNTFLILENAGNRKIGQKLDDLVRPTQISPRVRICLDTCHLHAAGYDLSSKEKLDQFWELLVELGIEDRIELWHLNDSRDEFGSLRDRHENIGEGEVGLEVFRQVLNHPNFSLLPFIIETPGFDNNGPDKKNLDILKSLLV